MQWSGASAARGVLSPRKPNRIFYDREVELLDDADQFGASRRRHGDSQRIVNRRLNVQGRHMRFANGFLDGVRTNPILVHRQRHQRNAKPRRDVLDERVGQRLDPAAASVRHCRGKRRSNALPSVRGEDHLIGVGRPVLAGEEFCGDRSRCRRADAGRLA